MERINVEADSGTNLRIPHAKHLYSAAMSQIYLSYWLNLKNQLIKEQKKTATLHDKMVSNAGYSAWGIFT